MNKFDNIFSQYRKGTSNTQSNAASISSGTLAPSVRQVSSRPPVYNDRDFEKLRDIIVEELGVDADEVQVNSHFVKDLGADSLDLVELVMAAEEEFDIEIPDEIANKMHTVADALNYIQRNR